MYSQSRNHRPHLYGASPPPAPVRHSTHSAPQGMPSYHRRVNVPPNYSGLAIVDGEEHALGVESLADAPPAAESAVPLSGRLPENRDFGQGEVPEPRFSASESVGALAEEGSCPHPAPPDTARPPASSVGGGWLDPAHFPFGHGIGAEEWLLLGLILLLLHEAGGERGDLDETVVLLALLLLGG